MNRYFLINKKLIPENELKSITCAQDVVVFIFLTYNIVIPCNNTSQLFDNITNSLHRNLSVIDIEYLKNKIEKPKKQVCSEKNASALIKTLSGPLEIESSSITAIAENGERITLYKDGSITTK